MFCEMPQVEQPVKCSGCVIYDFYQRLCSVTSLVAPIVSICAGHQRVDVIPQIFFMSLGLYAYYLLILDNICRYCWSKPRNCAMSHDIR